MLPSLFLFILPTPTPPGSSPPLLALNLQTGHAGLLDLEPFLRHAGIRGGEFFRRGSFHDAPAKQERYKIRHTFEFGEDTTVELSIGRIRTTWLFYELDVRGVGGWGVFKKKKRLSTCAILMSMYMDTTVVAYRYVHT